MAENYYELLGVNKSASEKEIKTAYRRMARKLHPDVNPNNQRAQDQFKKVNEAYDVVGDTAHRKDYDQFGDNWKHADQMRNMGGGSGRGPGQGGGGFNMNDLFGGGQAAGGFADMFGGGAGRAQQRRQQRPPEIIKHQGTIDVSLDEVYTGASRRISIGTSGTAKRNLEVDVPKGVLDGTKIRLRPDAKTEVTLTVKVRPDKRFSREGANLRADINVPLFDAILGGEAEVPTMTGRIALNIPAGTQNGRSFKIKGRGLPKANSDDSGDLYATIRVRLPDTLSDKEKWLYSQLRDIRNGRPAPDDLIDVLDHKEESLE
jgi:curved DNA-binding protein